MSFIISIKWLKIGGKNLNKINHINRRKGKIIWFTLVFAEKCLVKFNNCPPPFWGAILCQKKILWDLSSWNLVVSQFPGQGLNLGHGTEKPRILTIRLPGNSHYSFLIKVLKREGGSGWGTHVNPWLIHVNVWQKTTTVL